MSEVVEIRGRKGGSSKPKAPYEAPDSLQSIATAKILLAVGEGEFAGTPTERDIYLDNTPLADPSGKMNFPGVKWEWRPGSIDQTYIPGIPSVENDTQINIELRSDSPFVRSISNTQLSAVRVRFAWPALQQQKDNGDLVGYRIEYAVDVATDGGAYVEVLREAVDGKTTTRYERSRRIDLPPADSGWQVRVRRLTPNANSNRIADTMLVAAMAEVIDAKIEYRNTALLFIEFSAEQFANIPAVTVHCKARKWPVPSNYDPETRTYSGVWDGSFKEAWTNNPAWITYGLCINDRFGLGRRIKPWMVDQWELYRIAQYCDQLVPDGKGGMEPRFLCDMNLQAKADAWALLRDIAAIYRGMTYWAQGQLQSQADMPRAQDFDYVFTRANVVDGEFNYGSASARTRYSRALVSYDNPDNNYDTDVTPVTDRRLQRRYGDNPVEISAIGCTRESEAQRRGKWLLMSNSQDRTVSFRTGMEGRIPLPGHIIPVADALLAGREIGGRISAVSGLTITLDRDTQAKPGDRLILNLPSGSAEGRTIHQVSGRSVTVTAAYSEQPHPQLGWALDADDLAVQLYRVMKTVRDARGDYEITALQYEPSKFAHIDTGAKLESRPVSVIPTGAIDAPASVEVTSSYSIDQGIAIHTMTISWPSVSGAVAYDVEWRKDSGNWVRLPRTGALGIDVSGIYAGDYVGRVRAVNAWEIASVWRESMLTHLEGKQGTPPAPAYLNATGIIFGIDLRWGFPAGAEDTLRTEIQYNTQPSEQDALHLGDYAYPLDNHTMSGLRAAQVFYFRARLVDRTGNIGPWTDWVYGQSSADADEILDYIAGQIGETELNEWMQGEIDKISGDGIGSVNERIAEAVQDAVDALAYDPDEEYAPGETVRGGPGGRRLYQALVDVPTDTPPPNANYWMDVGQVVEDANGVVVQVQQNTADIQELDGAVTAQGESLDVISAGLRPERADGDKADALRGYLSQASISESRRVSATEAEASAERDLLIQAQLGDANAALLQEQVARASADSALAQNIETLEATVNDEIGAAVQNLQQAVADEASARAKDITTVQASVTTAQSTANQAAGAAGTAQNTANQASQAAGAAQSTANQAVASVQTVSEAVAGLNGKLSTMWGVKMQVNSKGQYVYAGIGLGIENGPGGLQSQFLVEANRFALLNTLNGITTTPFVVEGGQVFMNSAVIKQADIVKLIVTGVLQSSDYEEGKTGVRLNFLTGEFEMNGQLGGGWRQSINNMGNYIWAPDQPLPVVEIGKFK